MKMSHFRRALAVLTLGVIAAVPTFSNLTFNTSSSFASDVKLKVLGSYAGGSFNQGGAEIVTHDPASQRLFVVNGATSRIDVLSIVNPSAPTFIFSIDLSPYGRQANSVAVKNGIVAVAVEAVIKTDNGKVALFTTNGAPISSVTVGALPDMLTFTPDGNHILVANEGEPNNDYTIDPKGTVSIINVAGSLRGRGVMDVDFTEFNNAVLEDGIRIFGPNARVDQDLEPEYITISADSTTAWVTLQENNAIGVLDIPSGRFTRLIGLGFADHSRQGQGLDTSDRDSAINIANWPVLGMYQPDGIASFSVAGETFLITANEGDAREYTGTPGFVEEARVSSLNLDPSVFVNGAFLKQNANLGRLNVSKAMGNTDGDGDYDALYSFGARSFSILTSSGVRIYDSGDDIEQLTAATYPLNFNASNSNNTFDDRSDNKGPEPEGVTTGEAYGRIFAFIVLERIGGVLVYDVSDPFAPQFVQYINNRNFLAAANTAAAGDLGPEGVHFIKEGDSPTGKPLLVVANEVSATTTVYELGPASGR